MKKVLAALGIAGGALCIFTVGSILLNMILVKQELSEYEKNHPYY